MTNLHALPDLKLRALGRAHPELRKVIITELKRRETAKLSAIAKRLG